MSFIPIVVLSKKPKLRCLSASNNLKWKRCLLKCSSHLKMSSNLSEAKRKQLAASCFLFASDKFDDIFRWDEHFSKHLFHFKLFDALKQRNFGFLLKTTIGMNDIPF